MATGPFSQTRNRFGEVEEVSGMLAWLAFPLCTFATGTAFDLSEGGATY
jgi:3-oxoacyl-[acyl-carrier protein] reductase